MPQSFEDLPVWQRARELVRLVYALTRGELFSKDFSLVDQIRRAAISVLSNIPEGFERGSNAEFIQFLFIAKGSAGEVRAQLYAALDQRYVTEAEFKKAAALCRNVSGQLSGLIDYLKGSRLKGEKFRTKYTPFREEVEKITNQFKIQDSKFNNDPEKL